MVKLGFEPRKKKLHLDLDVCLGTLEDRPSLISTLDLRDEETWKHVIENATLRVFLLNHGGYFVAKQLLLLLDDWGWTHGTALESPRERFDCLHKSLALWNFSGWDELPISF